MVTWQGIEKRITRLDELALGLARETVRWQESRANPLTLTEEAAYLKALADALSAVEAARVVLAKARRHQEGREVKAPRASGSPSADANDAPQTPAARGNADSPGRGAGGQVESRAPCEPPA
jgi:hypothetical protein